MALLPYRVPNLLESLSERKWFGCSRWGKAESGLRK